MPTIDHSAPDPRRESRSPKAATARQDSAPARREPMVTQRDEPAGSRTPLPNDHVRAIIELLREGTPDLARRWLAALLLVPPAERAGIVSAVEAQIVREFATSAEDQTVRLVHPPVAGDGFIEQRIVTYTRTTEAGHRPADRRRGNA